MIIALMGNLLKVVRFSAFCLVIFCATTTVKVSSFGVLVPDYYRESCPLAEEIVREHVRIAAVREPRMAASLLRLHFHDCFVLGCDGSVLLDSHGGIISEKEAGPNLGSLRGFEVIDKIKAVLEEACPATVSCADILAIAAKDAVELRGGPSWKVELGRRDSLEASLSGANERLPAPNSTLEILIAKFEARGLDIHDLVTLSGSHTIGKSRCISIKQRIYDNEYYGNEKSKSSHRRNNIFFETLRSICPKEKRDDAFVPLDFVTSAKFDNQYFLNLIRAEGMLESDDVLLSQDLEGNITNLVWAYASDQQLFFKEFAKSMLRMGNMNPLTGDRGEIRLNCRFLNFR